jgi:hypothetical protein
VYNLLILSPLLLILMFIFVDCKCKLCHTAYCISASVYSEIHIEQTPVFSYIPRMDVKNVIILIEHIPCLMLKKKLTSHHVLEMSTILHHTYMDAVLQFIGHASQ